MEYNTGMQLSPLAWFLSFLPVLVVIVLMLGLRWSGARASFAAWLSAILLSLLAFGGTWHLLAWAQLKALWMALDVLYIVWGALLLYHLVQEAGAIEAISARLPAISSDRGLQVLLVSWLLVSFLQGMGGFGVPMAVCAPILVGMGYSPVTAVVMTALGHAWAVNFGSMSTAFTSLLVVTDLPGELLAPFSALLLGLAILPAGVLVTLIGTGWKGLRHSFPALLAISLVMAFGQYLLAANGLWALAATGSAVLGVITLLLLTRLPRYRAAKPAASSPESEPKEQIDFWWRVSPYLLLMLIGFAVVLIKPLFTFLNQATVQPHFPTLSTTLGWVSPSEPGRAFHFFSHPGTILLYTSLISACIYSVKGLLRPGAPAGIWRAVRSSAVDVSLGVLAMVGVASVMTASGMTNLLARGLSQSIPAVIYPAVAPLIGVLGAFLTGSNNNSNVLFGVLQMETARLLGLNVPLILAAQTAGGSLGSVLSPAKVIVGCSTVGLTNQEALVMRKLVPVELIPVGVVSLAALLISLLMGSV
ncbi:MAG: L-lactate permease [Chloroflexi bacterium]|nr:L-lactate permease [Chloroflexota bacterium]